MKKFIVFLLLLAACIVGLGFYLDWFNLTTSRDDKSTNINLQVDTEKVQQDQEKAKQELKGLGEKIKGNE